MDIGTATIAGSVIVGVIVIIITTSAGQYISNFMRIFSRVDQLEKDLSKREDITEARVLAIEKKLAVMDGHDRSIVKLETTLEQLSKNMEDFTSRILSHIQALSDSLANNSKG